MARIVSGSQQPQDPNFALMQGLEMGRAFRQAQPDNEEQVRLMLQIKGALMEQDRYELAAKKEQRAEAEARQEQMDVGKAGKLQQFAMRAQSGQAQPGQKIVDRIIGARGRLKDPKALAMFDHSVKSLLETQKAAKAQKAMDGFFSNIEKDARVFTPEDVAYLRNLKDSGATHEELVREESKLRISKAEGVRAREENERILKTAMDRISIAPDGEGKLKADAILRAVGMSDVLMDKPGAVAEAMKDAELAIANQGQSLGYNDPKARAAANEDLTRELGQRPTEDELREYMQFIDPSLQPPQAEYAERVPVMKIHALVGQSLQSGADAKGVAEALQQAGIPLTENTLQLVRSAMTQFTGNARAAAGDARERR